MKKEFGLDITMNEAMLFKYGSDCFGPQPEQRTLDSIRPSLMDPQCDGPQIVYSIVMDVGDKQDRRFLEEQMLLFGVVGYAAGKLGREPVRSQGHIHKISLHSGWSPPEVYEIWQGKAIIYMQEFAEDNPGKCYAVVAEKGEVVIVPPTWAHATISANPAIPLVFGAWCDREYGFEYEKVRAHKGLAWYPLLDEENNITWQPNPNYMKSEIIIKKPGDYYKDFSIEKGIPIYTQFQQDHEKFQFVSKPQLKADVWKAFIP
ncbi:glucose-6-phosphate isomerase family protein [Niabella aquatica]